MDPISLTASVIAMIQLAEQIISVCTDYISSIKDAPRTLRTVAIEVGSIKCVLEVLQMSISANSDDYSAIMDKFRSSDNPLLACRRALESLEKLLPPTSCTNADGKRTKCVPSLVTLQWPFKEKRVKETLEDIGRYKATISLTLTVESA